MVPTSYTNDDVIEYICEWFGMSELADAEWKIVEHPADGCFRAHSDALAEFLGDDELIVTYRQLMAWVPYRMA